MEKTLILAMEKSFYTKNDYLMRQKPRIKAY